ncbi:hypothetical protein ACWGLC_15125 [Dietzia sp. NPDC055877]
MAPRDVTMTTTTRSPLSRGWALAAWAFLAVVVLVASMAIAPTSNAGPATGPQTSGQAPAAQPGGPIHGYIDAHAHIAASEAFGGALRCGRPFAPGGLAEAMADCPSHSGTGHFALLEGILGGTDIPGGAQGFPTFTSWPAHNSQLHEQAYYTGIERSWRAGQRVLNNHLVANRVLCEMLVGSPHSCDEMDQLRRQVDYLNRMEAHIDAEHGGPGQGWFRIARSPEDVRRIAGEGKLAVTLGVEASEPFGCRTIDDIPQCAAEDIDRGLDEFASWGVSTVFPVHKFDNALGGARMDEDLAGLAVNIGNKLAAQRFWETRPCTTDASDHAQPLASTPVAAGLAAASSGAPAGAGLPVYPQEPLCNVRGLTPLGEHAVRGLMDRGMLINLDHMSVASATRTLDLAEEVGYGGLVVDHTWSDPALSRRMHEMGGFTAAFAYPPDPTENFDEGFLDSWRATTAGATRPWDGYGIGSDVNGLAPLAEPRPSAAADPLVYPFTAPSGEVMDRWRFAERVYDLNVDGVAQYGLYADWITDVLHRAGPDRAELERQLMGGAEAWVATWERAR